MILAARRGAQPVGRSRNPEQSLVAGDRDGKKCPIAVICLEPVAESQSVESGSSEAPPGIGY